MILTTWVNSKVMNLDWSDISLVKISVVGFTLMIAKLWEPLLSLNWYWYALAFVLAAIIPIFKMFKK